MTLQADILERFSDQGDGALLYLPNLSLWYEWHHNRDSLPQAWQNRTLPAVAQAMGVPVWLAVQPWRVETPGVEIVTTEQDGERIIRSETGSGTLVARWALGPDGDWWQTEYPVKSDKDLAAALELVEARSYIIEPDVLAHSEMRVGDNGILALEIPRRPYSDLLHQFLGWSEGLLLLGDPMVDQMLAFLEAELQRLIAEVAQLPGDLVYSPDNLDGQFISPRMFKKHLQASYAHTVETLHAQGKHLLVHAGGPIRHLLPLLAGAGVDGMEGIAGPPQSNASLAEARELAGPDMTIWGGIPQDFLSGTHDEVAFEAAVRQAAREARGDKRMILGVADRVPVDAELGRLEAIPQLLQKAR